MLRTRCGTDYQRANDNGEHHFFERAQPGHLCAHLLRGRRHQRHLHRLHRQEVRRQEAHLRQVRWSSQVCVAKPNNMAEHAIPRVA